MLVSVINLYRASFSGLSKSTWLLSLFILINRCGYMAVPFMGLYVTQSLLRPASDAGIIISIFGVGSILGAAAGGKLTDIFGFRPVQILAAFISGIFFIVFSWVTDFVWLCVLAFVISFFAEAFRPANFAAIAAYAAPGTTTRSYALNRQATNIGWAVGISLGGIIAAFHYPLLFVVDGVVSMVVAVAIFKFLPAIKGFRQAAKENKLHAPVMKPWKDFLFVKFIFLTMIFTTCFFLMFRVVPVFFKEVWHLNEAIIGLLLGVNGVVIALFEMVLISRIEHKRSAMFFIVLGVVIVSASFSFLMLPKIVPVIAGLFSVILFSVGEMISLPFINTFVINRSNEFNRGQYAAGYTLSWSFAQVIGPTAGFYIAEHFSYNVLWVSITVTLLVCAYGFYSLNTRYQKIL